MEDDSRAARARRRQTWTGALLTSQTPAQLPTAEERLMSMWQLALDAFGDCPDELLRDRSTWPGRLVRQ